MFRVHRDFKGLLKAAQDEYDSIVELNESLRKKVAEWNKDSHYKSCKNGSKYLYELTGTGIGTAITIKCPVCGEEKNITDYDCW